MAETSEQESDGGELAKLIAETLAMSTESKLRTHAQKIKEHLSKHHDGKFGYEVYRCTYESDEQWSLFLETLRLHCYARIDLDEHGSEIRDFFTLDVHDDKERFDGVSKSEVRRQFKEWVTSVEGPVDITRYSYCIYADQEVVDSILHGDPPGTVTLEPTSFVKLLDMFWEENQDSEIEQDSLPSIEGCTREDVGWFKSAVTQLGTRTYTLLMEFGWDLAYVRPPEISLT